VKTLQDSQPSLAMVLSAAQFAADKHRDHRRKDIARTPYINHPLDVAHILWFEGGVRDVKVLTAALLHDTVEDTDTSFVEVETHFGTEVRKMVEEVTDDRTLTSRERKAKQIKKASHISPAAQQIKLADKISNLRDIFREAPKGWSVERQVQYFKWAEKVINQLRGVNPQLEAAFDTIYETFFSKGSPSIEKTQ